MSLPDDSRPFTVLRQHVLDFKAGFDDDIKSCLDLLDTKLSALLQDPGVVNTPPKHGKRLNVDVEFSRAKYEIYMHLKALFDDLESSWTEQLGEMKARFLENVEILLAKTKLSEKSLQNDGKKSLKNRKERNDSSALNSSSLSAYSLIEKAKQLPVLNSLLPQSNKTDEVIDENGCSTNDKASKRPVRSQSSAPQSQKSLNKKMIPPFKKSHTQINEGYSLHDKVSKSPVKFQSFAINSQKFLNEITIPAFKEVQVQLSEDESDSTKDMEEEEESDVEIQDIVTARGSRLKGRKATAPKSTPIKQPAVVLTPLRRSAAKGRKSILKPDSLVESELHTTPSRSTRKRTAGKDLGASDVMECDDNDLDAAPKTPKNVHFSMGLNIHEDLEIYSPEINITRSAPRRKTVMTEVAEELTDNSLTPNIVRKKSKRKTLGGSVMENVPVAPSPERFKSSRNSSMCTVSEETEDNDLSGGESSGAGHYTSWILLDELNGKEPTQPGVYELKVYKAKKSAYIGSCDNLRSKLTLHKLGGNSGHKHLDKFLDRNKSDVQVRYEIMPSAAQAKNEEMKRIKSFVEQYRTTPSYN